MIAHCIAGVGSSVFCAAHVTAIEIEEAVNLKLLRRAWSGGGPCKNGLAGKWTRADVGWDGPWDGCWCWYRLFGTAGRRLRNQWNEGGRHALHRPVRSRVRQRIDDRILAGRGDRIVMGARPTRQTLLKASLDLFGVRDESQPKVERSTSDFRPSRSRGWFGSNPGRAGKASPVLASATGTAPASPNTAAAFG